MPLACAPRAAGFAADDEARANAAIRHIESDHTARLEQLEGGAPSEAALDAEIGDYQAKRLTALAPLVAQGNQAALAKLAHAYRDRDDAQGVRLWFRFTKCAADSGDPFANDELVRWYWHQVGDGSAAALQKNRALALDHAERSGKWTRIAIYIAGDVHQYPANMALAQEMLELCARADRAECQERLAIFQGYPWRLDEATRLVYAERLSAREASFRTRRDELWTQAAPESRARAQALLADWRPIDEEELRAHWPRLRAAILEHGAKHPMPSSACTTSTPWCRGQLLEAAGSKGA